MKIADIIIPHHNRHDHLKNCLECLPNDIFNIIIVSGGTFAENCNKGAKLADTNNLIFVNDDTLPDHKVLLKMIRKRADIVGTSQIIPNEGKSYGIGFDSDLRGVRAEANDEIFMPCGFLFLIRKKSWHKLKGFDVKFINGGEDSDLFIRAIQKKMKFAYVDGEIIHHHSQSEGRMRHACQNRAIWEKRWTKKKLIKLLNLDENLINQ